MGPDDAVDEVVRAVAGAALDQMTIVPSQRLVRDRAPIVTLVAIVADSGSDVDRPGACDARDSDHARRHGLDHRLDARSHHRSSASFLIVWSKGVLRPSFIRCRARDGESTTLSILDELPAELGGDLHHRRDAARTRTDRSKFRATAHRCGAAPVRSDRRSLCGDRDWVCFASARRSPSGGSIAILPASSTPQRQSGLTHRSLRDELGIRPRPARGEGTEFESLREYVSGDDPRHVDWHASARRGRLIVRQHQTERHHTVMIAVDTGRLMAGQIEAHLEARLRDRLRDCAGARLKGVRRPRRFHRVRSRAARFHASQGRFQRRRWDRSSATIRSVPFLSSRTIACWSRPWRVIRSDAR